MKLEVEVTDSTADELMEYVRWVELSSSIATSDAKSKTVDFALRDLFRHDRLWKEHQKSAGRPGAPPARDTPAAAAPAPAPLPPPASSARPVPTPTKPEGIR